RGDRRGSGGDQARCPDGGRRLAGSRDDGRARLLTPRSARGIRDRPRLSAHVDRQPADKGDGHPRPPGRHDLPSALGAPCARGHVLCGARGPRARHPRRTRAAHAAVPRPGHPVMFDLVVSGGTVVDGSGAPGYHADVGVGGETIAAIGDLGMSSVAAFRRHYHRKVAVNTAYLVPFATVRLEVLGFRDAPLRGRDLEAAGRLVREGLEQGAVGFSTGSKYYPGPWAETADLIALCEPVAAAGSVYMCEPRRANLERAHG